MKNAELLFYLSLLLVQYFVHYKLTPQVSKNNSNFTILDDEAREYREFFLAWLGLAAQIPNLLCNFFNIFCQAG